MSREMKLIHIDCVIWRLTTRAKKLGYNLSNSQEFKEMKALADGFMQDKKYITAKAMAQFDRLERLISNDLTCCMPW